ncbi:hypothetical protein TELCIR_13702 [Teladorsagia circumcincta]|uniref:Uncharacterized protein n=1 Tax=Teladorsagia circumcincta TaxID=45464 RepID=A0A2G9U319_TELCI|nr:hypothetical protein TELCIR_13702 [Teladorsagia circumcincta]
MQNREKIGKGELYKGWQKFPRDRKNGQRLGNWVNITEAVEGADPLDLILTERTSKKLEQVILPDTIFSLTQTGSHVSAKTVHRGIEKTYVDKSGLIHNKCSLMDKLSSAFEAYKASRPVKISKAKGPRRDERPSAPNPVERLKDIEVVEGGTNAVDIEDIMTTQ